jgi:4-amino-4-deoxy-L-arabinose transferase-like glycosyltransferase
VPLAGNSSSIGGRFSLLTAAALLIIAVAMRAVGIGSLSPSDFDEGVYWQTLRAMHAGNELYGATFYSQPPAFALITHWFFELGGQSLASARFGVALLTVLGIAGIGLVGLHARGLVAGLAAMALLISSPFHLELSQTLQADAPCAAFALLALGLTYRWLDRPHHHLAFVWAGAAGTALALCALTKLLCVAVVIPIGWLWLTFLWRHRAELARGNLRLLAQPAVFVLAGALVLSLFIAPFLGVWNELLDQVVTFHVVAAGIEFPPLDLDFPWAELGILAAAAGFGLWTAYRQRDQRVLPLLGWLIGTVVILIKISPVWPHHLVALTGPLIAVAVFAVPPTGPPRPAGPARERFSLLSAGAVFLALVVALGAAAEAAYFVRNASRQDGSQLQREMIADLRDATGEAGQVITDDPFVVAAAGRNVPPSLTDPSTVRIRSGYLTLGQLQSAALQPEVRAVLFSSGRFRLPEVAGLEDWLSETYRLQRDYGSDRRLWIR